MNRLTFKTAEFDVLGIGNAIVDVLAHADDAFLEAHDLVKGSMTLIDAAGAEAIYGDMGPAVEVSGGSAANSMAGVAALGGKSAFIGKVADDQLGKVFRHDITSIGVHYDTPPLEGGDPTARSFILVTPDAQRTMNTFLGASQTLGPDDISEADIARASMIYLEGYLWDPAPAKQAFLKAMRIANDTGVRVALTLSDSFCVHRYREEFQEIIENHVDILFANQDEIEQLYQSSSFEDAAAHIAGKVSVAALTRSEKGAVIISGEARIEVAAEPTNVEDTTGAGDLYASGFLHGLAQGHDLEIAARMGSIAAAEAISHVGARPEANLKTLVGEKLGL